MTRLADTWGFPNSVPLPESASAHRQQLKQTSDATSFFRLCCRASVCQSGKSTLNVASRALRHKGRGCRCRPCGVFLLKNRPVHMKVREPHLNGSYEFLPLALVLKGQARKVHANWEVQMWFANFRVNQPFLKGVGGRGLATNGRQNTTAIYSQNYVPLLQRGWHRKRAQKRGLNLWHRRDLLAPTPSVRQPLFETSD